MWLQKQARLVVREPPCVFSNFMGKKIIIWLVPLFSHSALENNDVMLICSLTGIVHKFEGGPWHSNLQSVHIPDQKLSKYSLVIWICRSEKKKKKKTEFRNFVLPPKFYTLNSFFFWGGGRQGCHWTSAVFSMLLIVWRWIVMEKKIGSYLSD